MSAQEDREANQVEAEATQLAPEVQTFDEMVAGKVHEHLCEIYTMEEQRLQTTDLLNGEPVCIVDATHKCLIEAHTTEAKIALWPFIHPQTGRRGPIDLTMPGGPARFNPWFLIPATNLLAASDEHVGVQTSSDHPLVMWNQHFRVVIAPTIYEDWETKDVEWGAYPLQKDQDGGGR